MVRVVCEDYDFKPSDLSMRTRQRGPAEARAVISLLAVELGTGTLAEVGRRFGRDVVTLSEGVKRERSRSAVEARAVGMTVIPRPIVWQALRKESRKKVGEG